MKFILSILICSHVQGTCLPPIHSPDMYGDGYKCMLAGYDKANEKLIEVGPEEVNKQQVFVKFGCIPYTPAEVPPTGKPA